MVYLISMRACFLKPREFDAGASNSFWGWLGKDKIQNLVA